MNSQSGRGCAKVDDIANNCRRRAANESSPTHGGAKRL